MSLVGRRPPRLRLINNHSCVLQPSPERRCWSSSAVRPPAAGSSRRPAPVTVLRSADGKVVTAGIHLSLCHTAVGWTKTAAPSFKAVIAFNWLQYWGRMMCVFAVTTCAAVASALAWRFMGADHRRGPFIQLLNRFLGDWISYNHPAFVGNPVVWQNSRFQFNEKQLLPVVNTPKTADMDNVKSEAAPLNGVKIKCWLRCRLSHWVAPCDFYMISVVDSKLWSPAACAGSTVGALVCQHLSEDCGSPIFWSNSTFWEIPYVRL